MCEAARLKAARHEDRVAAGLHPVRQCLIITDADADLSGMTDSRLMQGLGKRRITAAQQGQAPANADQMVDSRAAYWLKGGVDQYIGGIEHAILHVYF